MASTYKWSGSVLRWDDRSGWTLIAGDGNAAGTPADGDEIIVPASTVEIANITAAGGRLTTDGWVRVAGSLAAMTLSGGLVIGQSGAGTLSVTGGGRVVAKSPDPAATAALLIGGVGSGTVTVDGAKSILTSQGVAIVGQAGTGAVSLTSGATWLVQANPVQPATSELRIGAGGETAADGQGGSGTIEINGGSWLGVTGQLTLGANGGRASLVLNQGFVSVTGSLVAGLATDPVAGAATSARVDIGAGSRLIIYGADDGAAMALGVDKQTHASAAVSASVVSIFGGLWIGQRGSATVTVEGNETTAGAVFAESLGVAMESGSDGQLDVGHRGSVSISPGTLSIGGSAGAHGTIALHDGGRLSLHQGVARIGDAGAGTLSVTSGAVLALGTASAALGYGTSGTGSLIVSGGTVQGALTIGRQGAGMATLNSGGVIDAASGTIVIGAAAGSTGTIAATAGAITAGTLVVGQAGSAVATFGAGSTLTAQTVLIGPTAGAYGRMTLEASVLSAGGAGVFANHGTLELKAGATVTAWGLAVDGDGTVTVDNSMLKTSSFGWQQVEGTLALLNGGRVDAGTVAIDVGSSAGASGTIVLAGADTHIQAAGVNVVSGGTMTSRLEIGSGAVVEAYTSVGSGGVVALQGGRIDGIAMVKTGGVLQGYGQISGLVVSKGVVIATGGTLDITGRAEGASYTDQIVIGDHGTLRLNSISPSVAVTFGSGSAQTMVTTSSVFLPTVKSLYTGDTIGVALDPGVGITSAEYVLSGSIRVTLSDGHTRWMTADFDPGSMTNLVTYDDATTGYSFIQVGCFVSGTLIETAGGDVPVESLAAGTFIPTLLGPGPQPVVWLGRRHVDCNAHPDPCKVWPVRISAHAFGPGLPRRDLFLSPDHAVYVDEVLVP